MHLSHFSKYLACYAEPESRELPSSLLSKAPFDLGVAIPLKGEAVSEVCQRIEQIHSLARSHSKRLLVLMVVNGQERDASNFQSANRELLEKHFPSHQVSDFMAFEELSPLLSVLWVDRAISRPFPPKQGVGLARKIGCDILIRFRAESRLLSSWILTTDADATLPQDYFSLPSTKLAALHFPYQHDCDSFEGSQALQLYEIHLRYYFLGLFWAQSPYAYPAIGSCLAIDSDSYVKVRGFPDREAGEDFHLLNKLRKTGPISYSSNGPVTLRGRFSERVPFGTGQSTIDIHETLRQGRPFTLYSPKTFLFLKQLISEASLALLDTRDLGQLRIAGFWDSLRQEAPEVFKVVETLHIPKMVAEAFETRPQGSNRIRHFHTSFDALKTLRLIHLLTDCCFERLDWNKALYQSPFGGFSETPIHAEEALSRLKSLEADALGTSLIGDSNF